MQAKNLVLAVGSLVVAALALELGLRVSAAMAPEEQIEDSPDRPPIRQGKLLFADLLQPSANPEQIYELRPGQTGIFKRAPLTINADGYRGPQVSRPRSAGVDLRIVALGDSIAFGWGVADAETYVRSIERALREAHPLRTVEVVNLAIPGYNAYQEAALFEARCQEFRPDAVLLTLVANDLGLPNFLLHQPSPWELSNSRLVEFVAVRLARLRADREQVYSFGERGSLVRTRTVRQDDQQLAIGERTVLEVVPDAYRKMVGTAAVETALRRLAARAEALDIPVFVARYHPQNEFTRSLTPLLDELGWQTVAFEPAVQRYLDENEVAFDQLVLSRRDPHPNPVYHQLMADAFLDQAMTRWVHHRWQTEPLEPSR